MLINLSELFSCQGKMKTYTPDLEMFQKFVDKIAVCLYNSRGAY